MAIALLQQFSPNIPRKGRYPQKEQSRSGGRKASRITSLPRAPHPIRDHYECQSITADVTDNSEKGLKLVAHVFTSLSENISIVDDITTEIAIVAVRISLVQ